MKKYFLTICCLVVAAFAIANTSTNSQLNTVNSQLTSTNSQLPKIKWRLPEYSLVARSLSLREGFKTFATAQGISVVMSDEVGGNFSGEFKGMPSDEFLDRVTTLHNLIWYFDGATLYIYGSGEVNSMLLSLRYMKAQEVVSMLQELGIEDSRFPIRTASDDELIYVSGPPRYVALIAETIARADNLREQRTFNEVETRLFPLQYTWADDVSMRVSGSDGSSQISGVASILRDVMQDGESAEVKEASVDGEAKDGESSDAKKPATTPFRPIIRAENRLNAVMVRDVVTRMPMYERLIKELDKPQQLVEIVITKVEMSRENALDWQLSLSSSGSQDDVAFLAGQNVDNLSSELSGKGLSGVMSYIGDTFKIDASLTALRKKGKARNISRTSLLTVNNMAARITDTQSYHARVVGSEVVSLEEVSAGTELEVKPRVVKAAKEDDPERIWMSMVLTDGGFETVAVDSMPMTSESTVETQTLVPVGKSILLAGYVRDIYEDGGWGIPYLRDIPIIGWLFGGKSTQKQTVQRLFIVTPYLVSDDEADLVRMQATRQRDLTEPLSLEKDSDSDYATRRDKEARIKESQEIYEREAEEAFERNEAERELQRMKFEDQLEIEREAWQKDYDARRNAYEEERQKMMNDE